MNTIIDNGMNVRNEFKSSSLEELIEYSKNDRLNYSILFLNIEKNINISNLIRSAHLLGATRVFLIGSTRYDRRGTVGAQHYTEIHRIPCDTDVDSLSSCINDIKSEYNMKMLFLEQNENSVDLSSSSFENIIKSNHCCIVIGNEGVGIPKEVIDNTSDSIVEISQLGVIRSLNAAVAGSIVMFKIKEFLEGK